LSLPQTGTIKAIDIDQDNKQTGLFSIELNSREYILQAKSSTEAQKWVSTLNNLKLQNASKTSSPPPSQVTANTSGNGKKLSDINDLDSLVGSTEVENATTTDWKKSTRKCFGCC
jgi:archaellum component FlaF (FlaF/FlaG flagellin family)